VNCPPIQLQCPGCQIARGDVAGGGVSLSGAGGAIGATMTVMVPALLGASVAGAVDPNCCVAGGGKTGCGVTVATGAGAGGNVSFGVTAVIGGADWGGNVFSGVTAATGAAGGGGG
jgi:hypothetical protein